MIKYSLLVVT